MINKDILRLLSGYLISISIYVILIPLLIIRSSKTRCAADNPFIKALSLLLITTGTALYLCSHAAQALAKGGAIDFFGINVSPRTQRLLKTGPYALVRNPMALGAYLGYAGLAILRGSYKGLSLLAASLPFTLSYFKFVEERRLLSDFREEFIKYRDSTPLIFPCSRLYRKVRKVEK